MITRGTMQITEPELALALTRHHPGRAQLPDREAASLFRIIREGRAEGAAPSGITPAGTRAWFLEIAYPEGSQAPDWEPAGWRARARVHWRRPLRRVKPFRWPRRRLFLSQSGAWRHAAYLTWCGAQVRVHRSDPVTWPAQDGELVTLCSPDQEEL